MTRGVDEVDKVLLSLAVTIDVVLVVEGHSGGFDGNTSGLFVLSGIHVSGVSSLVFGDNTGFGDEGVGQSGLTVIDAKGLKTFLTER